MNHTCRIRSCLDALLVGALWLTVCVFHCKLTECFWTSPTAIAAKLPPSRSLRLFISFTETIPPETFPLPSHTFAGMVERAMIEKFGGSEKDIERVLKSWRLMDRNYIHEGYVGTGISQASQCHQLCHSYVPGLAVKEFWNTDDFDWCQKLKSKYPRILDEFLSVTADMDKLIAQGNNIWQGALTDDASGYGEGWRTLVLMNRGMWDPINVNLFPVTSKAVAETPAVEVFFASMKPNTAIKPHSDFTNFVLTSHLALDIPYSGQNKCRLTIGDTVREWINGEIMMFDTSIMHEAVNESDQMRYILMLRVWHPDLTNIEREALQFIYDCLEFPELISAEAPQRYHAERMAESSRAFPTISKSAGSGFAKAAAKVKKSKKQKG